MTTSDLLEAFLENHPADAARSLERQPPAGAAALLGELPSEAVAPAFGRLDPLLSLTILEKLPPAFQVEVIGLLETHKAAALLRRMDIHARGPVLDRMPMEKRQPLMLLLGYPENTVGARMDPCYPCLPEDLSLSEALDRIQTSTDRTALFWFTVDRSQVLTGVVSIRDLLSPNPMQKLVEVRQSCEHHLSALTDMTTLRSNAELKRLNALPVVDEKNVYLGAIRHNAMGDLEELDELTDSIRVAGSALGELYRLGLSGLVYSLDPGAEKSAATRGSSL